jgi:hypothetical protein
MKKGRVMHLSILIGLSGLIFTIFAGLRQLWNGILWLGGSANSIKSAHRRLDVHEERQAHLDKVVLEIREEIGKIYAFMLSLKQ